MPLEVRKREIEYNFNPFIAVLHISLMNAGWQTFDENTPHHIYNERVKNNGHS
jgi:hypothetical protein